MEHRVCEVDATALALRLPFPCLFCVFAGLKIAISLHDICMLPFFLPECADLHCFLLPAAPQRGEVTRFTMVTMLGRSMLVS